jgi:hypothetical protein
MNVRDRELSRCLNLKEEITREWRKLKDEYFHNLYHSLDVIRVITPRRGRWDVHVERMMEFRGTHEVLAGKLERGMRALGKNWCRERDNAEMNVDRFAWHRTGTSIGLL